MDGEQYKFTTNEKLGDTYYSTHVKEDEPYSLWAQYSLALLCQ